MIDHSDDIVNLARTVIGDESLAPELVVQKLLEMPLSSNDSRWISILEMLADRGAAAFYHFVSGKLVEVATPSPAFYSLLEKLEQEEKGAFALSLIEVGERHPEAQSIFEGMKSRPLLFSTRGFLFGGIVRVRPAESLAMLKAAMEGSDEQGRVFASQSLRIAGEALAFNASAMSILAKGEKDSNRIVRSNILTSYFMIYRKDREVINRIVQFIGEDPSLCAQALLLCHGKIDGPDVLKVIRTCMTGDDFVVAREISQLLPNVDLPINDRLEIIRQLSERGNSARGADLDYAIEQLAIIDEEQCVSFIEKWISEEEDEAIIRHVLPTLLYRVLARNKRMLLDLALNWINRGRTFREVSLEATREMLGNVNDEDPIVTLVLESLVNLAKGEGKDPTKILGNEPKPRIQCMMLISEIETERPPLSYDVIETSLRSYPNISKFIDPAWIPKMKRIGTRSHPLLILLSRPSPDPRRLSESMAKIRDKDLSLLERATHEMFIWSSLSANAYLALLNWALSKIELEEKGVPALRRRLQTEEEFDSAYSELEVVALLRSRFKVEMHPAVGHAQREGEHPPEPDLKIFNSSTIFAEVITPGTLHELLHSGQAVTVRNRAGGKLVSEVEKHLKSLPPDWEHPFLVIIDRSQSEIDRFFVENALWGSEAVQFEVPRGKSEAKAWAVRLDDAITRDPKMSLLSGVLIFKTEHTLGGVPYYDLNYAPNPTASHPLDPSAVQSIMKCFPPRPRESEGSLTKSLSRPTTSSTR